jgi:hypothetical protein
MNNMSELLTNGQVIEKIEHVMKEQYLPAFNNMINTQADPLLAKIAKPKLISDKIVAAAPFGLNGGFGSGIDGGATPISGAQAYENFALNSANMYCNIEISDKTVELGGKSGAILDTVHAEIEGGYKAAEWNVGRMIFGNGTGVLTKATAGDTTKTVSVNDTRYLIEGLTVDGYSSNGTKTGTDRIKSIDRVRNTVTFWGDGLSFGGVSSEGFMTVQNSYNAEITGIGAIFDDEITTLYGVSKSANPIIKPVVKNAEGDISDAIIRNVLREADRTKNGKVDTMLCGDIAYDAYTEYLRTNNIRVETKTKEITGGFKAISFLYGNREIDIVESRFVPSNEMWGADSSMFELHNVGWDYARYQGGSIFNLVPGTNVYRALLRNYGNLICKNPGGCVRIHNIGFGA